MVSADGQDSRYYSLTKSWRADSLFTVMSARAYRLSVATCAPHECAAQSREAMYGALIMALDTALGMALGTVPSMPFILAT